ncbi:MAG: HoxN/HupN/NixA family nickel/cobalt transporter [Actinomycetota bacterium]|nr:HoxN/HupN/NixA family nickel/cobalt transporter [Actinomycetota bacterium]
MMLSVVGGLHVFGFVSLFALVAPHHYHLGASGTFTIGIGLTAYTLGMRHAFDADHISAIDNTTRKLMSEGKRPLSVGFWFSLGHSSIVFGLAFLISVGVRALDGPVKHGGSSLHQVTGWVGTTVSGSFLYLIAALNLVILFGILKVFRELKSGRFDEAALEEQLSSRGLMNRFFGRLTRTVTKPQQMYPIGALFGLGFDTATEVALLVIAGSAGAAGLPWYAVLCLPILFAAGMSLLDSIDGSFMNFAYGWAFSKPVRKVFYNITITGLSVAIALVIGTIELGGLLAQHLNLSGWFWNWFENIDMNLLGFVTVGMFVATWAIALAVWHFGKIEERWSAHLGESEAPSRLRPAETAYSVWRPSKATNRPMRARSGSGSSASAWTSSVIGPRSRAQARAESLNPPATQTNGKDPA